MTSIKDEEVRCCRVTVTEFYKRFGGKDLGGGRPTRIMTKVIDTAMYTEGTYTQDLTRQPVRV